MSSTDEPGRAYLPDPECGAPGGGRGRRDEVGGSGVHPASAGNAPPGAAPRKQGEWGRGGRDSAEAEEPGPSEPYARPARLDAGEAADAGEERTPDDAAPRESGEES